MLYIMVINFDVFQHFKILTISIKRSRTDWHVTQYTR